MKTVGEKDHAWRAKANEIIGTLCRESYLAANTTKSGKRRKRHVPYSVPVTAKALVECLNKNDEVRAKNIFLKLNEREVNGTPATAFPEIE